MSQQYPTIETQCSPTLQEVRLQSNHQILKYFAYEHLRPDLQPVSKSIGDLAREMAANLPDCAQKDRALQHLLEAKDCFVRAALEKVDAK